MIFKVVVTRTPPILHSKTKTQTDEIKYINLDSRTVSTAGFRALITTIKFPFRQIYLAEWKFLGGEKKVGGEGDYKKVYK